jgi:hypothetical protein
MSDSRPRTPRAEERIRLAQLRAAELSGNPDGCIALWEAVGLPLVAPALRDAARAAFLRNIQDAQFRSVFALWACQNALKLYEQGALD